MRSGILYRVMRWHVGLCTAALALVDHLLTTRQRRGKIHGISASISASLWLHARGYARPGVCTRAAAGRRCVPACRAMGMAFLLLLLGQIALASAVAGATITGVVRDALEQPLAGAAIRLETRDGQVLHRCPRGTLRRVRRARGFRGGDGDRDSLRRGRLECGSHPRLAPAA
jgi:hypothetical protein